MKDYKEKKEAVLAWLDNLKPKIINLKVTKSSVSFHLLVEPIPQVRQTQGGGWKLPALKYNNWKVQVAECIKEALRKKGFGDTPYFKNKVSCVFNFYITENRKYLMADTSNFLKAIEDSINACNREEDKRYPESTSKVPLWQDDRKVVKIETSKNLSSVDKIEIKISEEI